MVLIDFPPAWPALSQKAVQGAAADIADRQLPTRGPMKRSYQEWRLDNMKKFDPSNTACFFILPCVLFAPGEVLQYLVPRFALLLTSRRLLWMVAPRRCWAILMSFVNVCVWEAAMLWVIAGVPEEFVATRCWLSFANLTFLQVVRPLTLRIDKELYLRFVTPASTVMQGCFFLTMGHSLPLTVVVVGVASLVSTRIFLRSYNEGLAVFELQEENSRSARRTAALKTAFEGMLNSLFDASCICNSAGVIQSATPQMQTILGGSKLEGMSLVDFASSDSEKTRIMDFLRNLLTNASAQQRQLSFQRQCATSGASYTMDACLNGIGVSVPADTEGQNASDASPRLLIGLQLKQALSLESVSECDSPQALSRWDFPEMNVEGAGSPCSVTDEATESLGNIDVASRCSFWTTPAFLGSRLNHSEMTSVDCGAGDCLPPDAVVWVEGSSMPVALEELSIGQKVLCYDRLSRQPKFSAVTDVDTHPADQARWVVVTLSDGSELQLTADHPVFVEGSGCDSGACLRACDLKAEQHALQVLKLVPVQVKKVWEMPQATNDSSGCPQERVSLSVHQPGRHSILVSKNDSSTGQSIAVASSSMAAEAEAPTRGRRFLIKNTFIDEESSEAPAVRGRRSGSAPPSLQTRQQRHGRSLKSSSRVSTISWLSSKASESSSVDGLPTATVNVGRGVADRRRVARDFAEGVSLLQVLEAQRAGLRSVGSLVHAAGFCCPCLMEFSHRRGARDETCKFGVHCSHCHEDHSESELATMRQERLRRQKETRGKKRVRLT